MKTIPEFKSREEEAEFWATTSLADLDPSQLEEITVKRPRKPLTTTYAIRLPQETVTRLRLIAASLNVGPTQLARRFVEEGIASFGNANTNGRSS